MQRGGIRRNNNGEIIRIGHNVTRCRGRVIYLTALMLAKMKDNERARQDAQLLRELAREEQRYQEAQARQRKIDDAAKAAADEALAKAEQQEREYQQLLAEIEEEESAKAIAAAQLEQQRQEAMGIQLSEIPDLDTLAPRQIAELSGCTCLGHIAERTQGFTDFSLIKGVGPKRREVILDFAKEMGLLDQDEAA